MVMATVMVAPMVKFKNKWLGLALAAAIAFNTLLPFFAFYSDAAKTSVQPPSLASVFGDKILICTGDGFALVKWQDLLAGKVPVHQHKSYACALCYIAANTLGKMLLFAAAILCLARGKSTRPPLLYLYAVRLKQSIHSTSSPRAPPLSFCC